MPFGLVRYICPHTYVFPSWLLGVELLFYFVMYDLGPVCGFLFISELIGNMFTHC